ncbi:MAG: hypothetical protein ACOH2B_09970 [Burkholderiaceae bacterium]
MTRMYPVATVYPTDLQHSNSINAMNLNLLRENSFSPGRNPTVLIGIMLTATVVSFILWKNDPLIAEEDSALEWAQSALLLLACFMHGERTFHLKLPSLDFLIHAGLALLTYSFAYREFDFDLFGALEMPIDRISKLAGIALWGVLLIILTPRIKQIFSCRSEILALPVIALTIRGGLFYVASWPFDKAIFSALSHDSSRFIEEVLEINACIILFAASLADSSQQSVDSKV